MIIVVPGIQHMIIVVPGIQHMIIVVPGIQHMIIVVPGIQKLIVQIQIDHCKTSSNILVFLENLLKGINHKAEIIPADPEGAELEVSGEP